MHAITNMWQNAHVSMLHPPNVHPPCTFPYKTEKKLLKSVNLFDVFVNEERLGKGKKSYSVSYQFQDQAKTLKDKEIDKIMQKMISNYEQKIGAIIRK